MELPQSKSLPTQQSAASVVKALYVYHKAIPLLTKSLEIISRIEELGIDPTNALTSAVELYSEPTLVALRAQHHTVFDKFFEKIGQQSNNTDKVIAVVQKSSHPHADTFARSLKTTRECSALGETLASIGNYLKIIDLGCFSCDTRFSLIEQFSSELIISSDRIKAAVLDSVGKSAKMMAQVIIEKGTPDESTIKSFTAESNHGIQKIYASLVKSFEKKRLEEVLEILTDKYYATAYATWYQKAAAEHLTNKGSFKKAIRVSLKKDAITPPSTLDASGLSWKRALATKKMEVAQLTKQLQTSSCTKKAADGSYVTEETTEYVTIEDPRNEMQVTVYKTREPHLEKASEIGYHHRVSDLFMMDRAELVTKLATEKSIPLLIASEAVRQKTPALAADWYINYAHDGFFVDKSNRNVANKTLLCRILRKNKPAQEYFLVWGFLDDETCYHRGLTFNSSLNDSLTALASKTRYQFDFPELEKK